MKIYLASKSPRRKALLAQMGVEFDVLAVDTPEEQIPGETAELYSQRVTQEKLDAAWVKMLDDKLEIRPILCADTEVVVDGRVLGKPLNYQEAFNTLKAYSDRSHVVITSVGVKFLNFEKIVSHQTDVYFAAMNDSDIHHYLAMGDYQDKAGSYGIQSYIGQFIARIDGCFFSVMGLPLNTVRALLAELALKNTNEK